MPGRPSATTTRDLFRAAALFTFVTVAMGSMVAATDSSSACPAWPICYADRIGPGMHVGWIENPIIEFVHRVISAICVILLAVCGWRGRHHRDARLRVFPWVALAFAIAAAVFGMMTVLFHLPLALALVDVGGAVVALFLITIGGRALSDRPVTTSTRLTGRLAGAAFTILLVMHLIGVLIAGRTTDGTSSFTRVLSWPLWQIVEIDGHPAWQWLRMGMAAVALVLIVGSVVTSRRVPHLAVPSVVLAVATVAELAMGFVISSGGLDAGQTNGIGAGLAVAYAVTAVVILWCLSHLAADAFAPLDPAETLDRELVTTH